MNNKITQDHAEKLRSWSQTVLSGVLSIIGTVFGIYTWFHKDRILRLAPLNVSMKMDLKKSEGILPMNLKNSSQVPIDLQLNFINPCANPVFVLGSYWFALAYYSNSNDNSKYFEKKVERILNSKQLELPIEKYFITTRSEIVSWGKALTDELINPQESIAKKVIFNVDSDKFNRVFVFSAVFVKTRNLDGIEMKFISTKDGGIIHEFFRTENGKSYKLNFDDSHDVKFYNQFAVLGAHTCSSLSL